MYNGLASGLSGDTESSSQSIQVVNELTEVLCLQELTLSSTGVLIQNNAIHPPASTLVLKSQLGASRLSTLVLKSQLGASRLQYW